MQRRTKLARTYRIATGDGHSTEELVEAGGYAYAHSCVISENFPARHLGGPSTREIALLEFGQDVTAEEAIAEVDAFGLVRPTYEDALYLRRAKRAAGDTCRQQAE